MEQELPKGWKEDSLENLFQTIDGDRGKNYPKRNDYLNEGYCLFLSTKNVRVDGFDFKNQVFISKEKQELLRNGTLERGDLVLTTRGTLGNVGLYDKNIPFEIVRINSGMLILRKKVEELNGQFYKLYITSPFFKNQTELKRTGTAQPQLPSGILKKFVLPVPPILEQKRIVQKLDALLGIVKTAQERLDKIPDILKRFRQSVLGQAVSGKLTEEWRKENKVKIGAKVKIDNITEVVTKGASPKWQGINYVNDYDDNSILFITSENVSNFKVIESKYKYLELAFNDKQKRSILKKGDILTNIVGGSIGRTSIWNSNLRANINQAVCLIRLKKNVCLPEYLEIYLNSNLGLEAIFANVVDVARANVSLGTIKNISLDLPRVEEQKEIVRQVKSLFTLADRIEARYQAINAKVKTLPQAILAKAFRGELVPQDPNEEPASVLLERIKAERLAAKSTKKTRKKPKK